ncbi:O-antigen ligase family protein [Flavobacterium sp. CBA20B-1]|uniref:O-antigen ligase family protein n=1 Tax=unclassified Flavobacterium TaxID=196869 RepID=UPI002223F828|nr:MULTISPECIES: O-antigen ligase family protein [unclassified Flavobacterium]WCM41189.1 O-antigen ligase family protein [Flavobacterium sp. CBA20B-1]
MRLAKIFYACTCALGLFPLLKLNHFSLLMIIWFVLAMANAWKNNTFTFLKLHTFTFLILSFFCIMYLLYIPFTTDFKELSKSIIKSLPFLIFPLGFLVNKQLITKKFIQTFGLLYTLSVFILNGLGWNQLFNFGWNKAWKQNDFYHPIFRNMFHEATTLHLPYLGLLTIFAALWLTHKIVDAKKISVLNLFGVSFLLFSAYIYSARMALVCYLIGLLFILFKSIKKTRVKWSVLMILPLVAWALLWFSPIKERYIKVVEKEWILPNHKQKPHEVNYRYGIWHCATHLIANNWLLGVGADKVQEQLNKCYDGFSYKSYEDFKKVTYNTHNQYLDQLLKFGILGLILFVWMLLYFFPNSSVLYQTFLLIVAISFLTENILDRQIGVVFISLLNTIFVIYKINTLEKSISSRLVR